MQDQIGTSSDAHGTGRVETSSTPAISRKTRAKLALGALSTILAVGLFQTANERPAYAATRRTVCAQTLYVRDAPAGIFIGTLYYGQSIDVTKYSPSGDWAYGFAYGNVNKWGWVQNGWFCS